VFVIEPGGGVTSVVSNLTQTVVSQQNVVTGDISTVPSTAQIVAEVLAALNATTIPVNVEKINNTALAGSGVSGDSWRPA
jgi:hypothetical protein